LYSLYGRLKDMADKQRIKITVADRVYPLTVLPNQEEGLRKASKSIEEMIKQFEENYAVQDKQDVLAMCALQFASKLEQTKGHVESEQTSSIIKLEDLNIQLAEYLNNL
jgi:cell division protein ZapA